MKSTRISLISTVLMGLCQAAYGIAMEPRANLQERQIVANGISAFVKVILQDALEGEAPACAEEFNSDMGPEYNYAIGQDEEGFYWEVCWMNNTDTIEWTQNDADIADCLTNLHYTQESACISTGGSTCDNGYIDGGGRIDNIREPYLEGASGAQINAEGSVSFQQGWNFLVGQNVQTTNGAGPYGYRVKGLDGYYQQDGSITLQVNFNGANNNEYRC